MSVPVASDSSFLLDLYARHRRDPLSVPVDWRIAFELGDGAPADDLARRLIDAYRRHGIREARLDPLDLAPRATVATLKTLRDAITTDATRPVHIELGGIVHDMTLGAFAAEIHRLYAGTVALEAAHLDDDAQRDWLYAAWEREFTAAPDPALTERAYESIASADCFENFLHIKFPTKKRFGIEGAESTIVFLREVLRGACLADTAETVIGGMHRGRLCMLATVLGKPVGVLLAEIKGRDLTAGGPDYTGDVPYHLGYAGEIVHGDKRMGVTLAPHPSHLMTVAPVVTGLARARRDAGVETMCLLMHTDAAFSGQGLVSEVLQLGGLAGYTVGGTIHLVVDNQIGFTTLTSEARSSLHCTDIGKAVGAPVLHVNGDDPIAVTRVARVALAWRQAHRRDVVIDLVCYRRNGHNELDEPRFTQPRMWETIDAKPALRASFGARLVDAPALARVEARVAEFRAALQRGYEGIDSLRVNDGPRLPAAWLAIQRAGADALHAPVTTGMDVARLRALGLAASTIPDSIAAHPKVTQFYRARRASIEAGTGINFATAEALAFASLLADGVSVRLSGQDSVRGTFTQRHLAVHDMISGASVIPVAQIAAARARFEPINSPLAEYAVLGFDYGHSLGDPRGLTIWEAQFGDFLNGAQTMVDQYIVSAEAKWEIMSGLVMLLPHGLEGQGPDHSSARIERLLQLCAGGNVIVANPSTPANLFHLLRRQILAPWRKPLFVIAPKSLLRQRACVSALAAMGPGTSFSPIIVDPTVPNPRRLVLCSGKIAYELMQARTALHRDTEIAILRVEQLYPFPIDALSTLLAAHNNADCVWCQEEPENQGAAAHVLDKLRRHAPTRARKLTIIARPRLPVAAGGSIDRHDHEQAELLRRALT